MSTVKPNNNERANFLARAKENYKRLQYTRFLSALGQEIEETSVQIAQSSKQTRPVLFLTESRFIGELEKVIDHTLSDCSMSELETLINFSIALARSSGLTFQKISDIQYSTMKFGTKQSVEQRHRAFLEKLHANNFCHPEFADLILGVKSSAKEAMNLLSGWSGNLIQQLYAALYLAEVGIDQIESRIKLKIAVTPKNMYLLSNKEYIINIITYLFLQRIHIADLDKLTPDLSELVKLDIQHLSKNPNFAECYSIGYQRGLSFDQSFSLSSLSLGRLDHSLQYVLSNVAFIPHSLNSSVKSNGKNTEVIQFHDKLIANRAAISVLLADENKNQRANIKAMINVILAYHSGAEKRN